MHKTGTTSVQNILKNDGKDLKQLGYLAFVNLPQMNVKNDEEYNPSWIRDQIDIANKKNIKAIIFSAEMISTFSLKQMLSFFDIFYDHQIVVIACFRHWTSFLPSRWAQNCKRRDSQSFTKYINNLKYNRQAHIDARFDLIILRIMEANPSSIRLISYDNAIVTDSLVETILSAFDLPKLFIKNQNEKIINYSNVRHSTEITELVRLFNGVYSLQKNHIQNELFESINDATFVRRFYDYSEIVIKFMNERPFLKASLLKLLDARKEKFLLSSSDSVISKWENATMEISKEFVYNPCQSQLFFDISDNEIVCSLLTVDELPHSLRREMLVAFGLSSFDL